MLKDSLKIRSAQKKPSESLTAQGYLFDLFNETKTLCKDQNLSYRFADFSVELGLGESNIGWLLATGRRKISDRHLTSIHEALQLSEFESEFLDGLVQLSRPLSDKDRTLLHSRLLQLRKEHLLSADEQLLADFYSDWHHSVVYEMVGLKNFKPDARWISSHLRFRISGQQARESLTMLTSLGLIAETDDSKGFRKTTKSLRIPSRAGGIWLMSFHRKMLSLASSAYDFNLPEEREIFSFTGSVSKQGAEAIKDELARFRDYLRYLFEKHKGADTVVQASCQYFPVTATHDE